MLQWTCMRLKLGSQGMDQGWEDSRLQPAHYRMKWVGSRTVTGQP